MSTNSETLNGLDLEQEAKAAAALHTTTAPPVLKSTHMYSIEFLDSLKTADGNVFDALEKLDTSGILHEARANVTILYEEYKTYVEANHETVLSVWAMCTFLCWPIVMTKRRTLIWWAIFLQVLLALYLIGRVLGFIFIDADIVYLHKYMWLAANLFSILISSLMLKRARSWIKRTRDINFYIQLD